jgi:hypothetical protein
VTRLAHDRAASHFTDDDVDEELRRRLKLTERQRGDFAAVHAAPHAPGDVPDDPEARLVVLGPEYPHSAKSADSPARVAAQRFLDSRAAGDRFHRNMLVFLAPDRSRLQELRQAVRQFLAWKSIEAEKETLNLDNFQRRQAETKRDQFDTAVAQRIGETYVWVLTPGQSVTDPTVTWDETRVTGKLGAEEGLITRYSGVRLRMDLDRVPLWRGDHVPVKQLWSDYSQYLYLPRLRDSAVLLAAVQDGVALLTWNPDTFAYASAVDETSGRYAGLLAGMSPSVTLDGASVVVRPDVAQSQIEEDRRRVEEAAGRGMGEDLTGTGDGGGEARPDDRDPERHGPDLPARFYGRKTLEPVRLLRDVNDITDAIVQQLGRAADADVNITIEIEATSSGFDDDVRRTVTENARTLRFDTHEFESE